MNNENYIYLPHIKKIGDKILGDIAAYLNKIGYSVECNGITSIGTNLKKETIYRVYHTEENWKENKDYINELPPFFVSEPFDSSDTLRSEIINLNRELYQKRREE